MAIADDEPANDVHRKDACRLLLARTPVEAAVPPVEAGVVTAVPEGQFQSG